MQNQLKQIYFIVRFGNGRYVSMKVVTEIQKTILNKFITPSGINISNMIIAVPDPTLECVGCVFDGKFECIQHACCADPNNPVKYIEVTE